MLWRNPALYYRIEEESRLLHVLGLFWLASGAEIAEGVR